MNGIVLALFWIVAPAAFLIAGWITGYVIERNHLKSLAVREDRFRHIGITNLGLSPNAPPAVFRSYVDGQAVIAADIFKQRLSAVRNFFGGEMRSMGTVLSRARREAIVRMLEEADHLGADQIWNLRIETSTVGGGQGERRNNRAMAEVHAYGTAVKLRQVGEVVDLPE